MSMAVISIANSNGSWVHISWPGSYNTEVAWFSTAPSPKKFLYIVLNNVVALSNVGLLTPQKLKLVNYILRNQRFSFPLVNFEVKCAKT